MRFTGCGSEKGRFSFLLPPGEYELEAYSEGPKATIPEAANTPGVLVGDIRITVTGTSAILDLGMIELRESSNETGR